MIYTVRRNVLDNIPFYQIFTIIREMHISHLVERTCSATWKKKKKVQRKTDESCETRIVTEFPRCDEIVKRFMKAFMKGFTSHGPNWGPEFASATHVLSRRQSPLPSGTPRGPILILHLSLYLSLFARLRATSRVFSIDPRKCLVFHHHHIRRRYLVVARSLARSIASFSHFSLSFFLRTLVLHGYISRPVFSSAETFSRPPEG